MAMDNKLLKLDEIKASCEKCRLADLCLPYGMDSDEVNQLDEVLERKKPYQKGEHLFRAGDKSGSIFAVRSGALKSYYVTKNGTEQVLGFTLPGELVGFDGLSGDSYSSASVALEISSICELPYNQLEKLSHKLPGLQKQIMRLVGKEFTLENQLLMMLGHLSAEEKLAAFLLSLSTRYKTRGLSGDEFYLQMSRQDIGNYLGLAIETVSRLFARFSEEKLLTVNRKHIKIINQAKLESMVDGCIGTA